MQRNSPLVILILLFILAFVAGISFFVIHIITTLLPHSPELAKNLWWPFGILPLLLLLVMAFRNMVYLRAATFVYMISMLWLPVLIYLLMGSVIIWILSALVSLQGLQIISGLLFVGIVTIICAGIHRAFIYKIVTYKLRAPRLAKKWSDKKIVLVSDWHLGMIRRKPFAEKVVAAVNTLVPDIVLIGGDLIDGPVFPYDDDLSALKDIKSTFGTYYASGNHDEYNREQEKYYSVLEKYVTVLNDKKVVVNNTQIVGIRYGSENLEQTKERIRTAGYSKDMPSIAILHDPQNVHALADVGIDLSVSGHTHGGQFFPFTLAVWAKYKELTRGIHYISGMAHLTSVGIGTGGPLLRIGTQPEIAVISIEK